MSELHDSVIGSVRNVNDVAERTCRHTPRIGLPPACADGEAPLRERDARPGELPDSLISVVNDVDIAGAVHRQVARAKAKPLGHVGARAGEFLDSVVAPGDVDTAAGIPSHARGIAELPVTATRRTPLGEVVGALCPDCRGQQRYEAEEEQSSADVEEPAVHDGGASG